MIARRNSITTDAASSRPLNVRRRLDIDVRPVVLRGKRFWHLKDPLSLRYWQFGDEEFFLWQQLDGNVSLGTWQDQFRDRFAPRRIELVQLQHFLGMLHREGLVLSDVVGQADTMLERRATFERNQKLGTLSNLLAIRFRGIDPEPFLSRVYPFVRRLFHPIALVVCLIFVLSAVFLVLLRWPEFVARLPTSSSFLTVENLAWLAVALAMTKVLHELSHALTNKHFGGECHELGVLLLVFTPCLYCNVSDTWLVADKWKRIAVSAAGMYVDLILAAACTWLWWFGAPGLVNSLCFSVMIVGSIGTLFVNGNPLLRYDGYFIFSDWLEIPNLKSEADNQLRRLMLNFVFGFRDPPGNETILHRVGLLMYAIVSTAYRVCVLVLVLSFINQWFVNRRLDGFGVLLVAALIPAAVGPAVWQLARDVKQPRRKYSKSATWWLVRGVAVAAVLVVGFVPWPRRITAPVTITPRDSVAVYVSVPGRLVEHAEIGTRVNAGQVLARLENSEIDFQIVQLTAQRDQLRKYCELLGQQQVQDTRTGIANVRAQLPIARQSLQDVEQQLIQRLADQERLTLRAPCDGILLAPRRLSRSKSNDELPGWEGIPLASEHLGCFLESGVLIGYVAESASIEGTVLLDQSAVGDVGIGQSTRIQIDELSGQNIEGRISDIASTTTDEVPPELLAKGWFATAGGDPGKAIRESHYQAKITIGQSIDAPFGASGRARISVAPQSLFNRTRDFLFRTFRFS